MAFLTVELRNKLEQTVLKARDVSEQGAIASLEALAVHNHEPYVTLTAEQRTLRRRLRNHGRQLGDIRKQNAKQEILRLTRECAYEHWHRMLFARFLAENELLIEPKSGVAVTMAECDELARERGEDTWSMVGSFAQKMLPQIFRVGNPTLEVELPPETRQELEWLLGGLQDVVFKADDALGWTYQFWQSLEKKRVNDSGAKITGQSLPAVTQLFTEDYMVQFLLQNSLGAWHAGKVFDAYSELTRSASDEQTLRDSVALSGYTFDYLRFVRDDMNPWQPAAGSYAAWPKQASDLKILDPCCGSGHFLVAVFNLMVRLRMAEEGLSLIDAIYAVLSENIFGLELDSRCTQIAAFNLALAAWKMAGQVIVLPALNIACSGLSTGVTLTEWLKFAGEDQTLRWGMEQLYTLFEQAPELGSLIDPRRALSDGELFTADFDVIKPLLEKALQRSDITENNEQLEIGVTAQGIAKAAEILAGQYHLVITNVPYRRFADQGEALRMFSEKHFNESKHDLATVFLEHCLHLCNEVGTVSIVLPQNWLFLARYSNMRKRLLMSNVWHTLSWLGSGAFETITGEVVKPVLACLSRKLLSKSTQSICNSISCIDASEEKGLLKKSRVLLSGSIGLISQKTQLYNPDSRVLSKNMSMDSEKLLEKCAISKRGVVNGDADKWIRFFWEVNDTIWLKIQMATNSTEYYAGRSCVIDWSSGGYGMLRPGLKNETYSKKGVAISRMGYLPSTLYTGELYDQNTAVIVLDSVEWLPPFWCFSMSRQLYDETRTLDKKLGVTPATLLKIPFDLEHWQKVAEEQYPHGLPEPYSDDPTQWVFHGHPCGSVIWDEQKKCLTHGSLRTDAMVLQVAMARLLGYRWPAELDGTMELSTEVQEWVRKCEALLPYADTEGIVPLTPTRGKEAADIRLRAMLAAAYGEGWSEMIERKLLLTANGGSVATSLSDWIRDKFFEEHCKLFGHRPFIWHIWDGRKDGFSVLVNYHKLAGTDGRRVLENITYTLLGDWIGRQSAEQRENREGAEGRLLAAEELQEQLIKIIAGEHPYDVFIRWKPLKRQPIGWEPDINDGVRINIRPFLLANTVGKGKSGILRYRPNINWKKDRGNESMNLRPMEDYPWFWQCDPEKNSDHNIDFLGGSGFDGNRWNNLHYSKTVKQAARETAKEGKKC
jgi:hypothetical protein